MTKSKPKKQADELPRVKTKKLLGEDFVKNAEKVRESLLCPQCGCPDYKTCPTCKSGECRLLEQKECLCDCHPHTCVFECDRKVDCIHCNPPQQKEKHFSFITGKRVKKEGRHKCSEFSGCVVPSSEQKRCECHCHAEPNLHAGVVWSCACEVKGCKHCVGTINYQKPSEQKESSWCTCHKYCEEIDFCVYSCMPTELCSVHGKEQKKVITPIEGLAVYLGDWDAWNYEAIMGLAGKINELVEYTNNHQHCVENCVCEFHKRK